MSAVDLSLFLQHLPQPGERRYEPLGLILLHSLAAAPPNSVWHEPALVYVLQGRKCGQLGGQHFEVNAGEWLLIHLPQVMSCDTSELQGEPFLAMALSIDMDLVAELILSTSSLKDHPAEPAAESTVAAQSAAEQSALARLLDCLGSALDQQVLGASLRRELHYRALCSPAGTLLRQMAKAGSKAWALWRVVQQLRANLQQTPDMSSLAKSAAMSESAFYAAFKRQLGASPLQYLKQMRLQRARQLMALQGFGVAQAAFAVGYASASQFSREYRQWFGHPPSEAARWL